MAGTYPGIVKTTLDGVNQRDYLTGKSDKSARDTFFYYTGRDPSAVRYKNWKIYFAMVSDRRPAGLMGVHTFHWTQVANIKRDPFETSVGVEPRPCWVTAVHSPRRCTAYIYDWNILPIGQLLWLKELESYIAVPADAGPGELQPGTGSLEVKQQMARTRAWRLGRNECAREAIDLRAGAPEGAPALLARR